MNRERSIPNDSFFKKQILMIQFLLDRGDCFS